MNLCHSVGINLDSQSTPAVIKKKNLTIPIQGTKKFFINMYVKLHLTVQ